MSQEGKKGALVISLDFELYWGVRDHRSIDSYGHRIEGVHKSVPQLLDLFNKYDIHATWATVGFLFCHNKKELEKISPQRKPSYLLSRLDPYSYLEKENLDDQRLLYFAPELIKKIASYPQQDIGSHSYSHFYSAEVGQTEKDFVADIKSAKKAARILDLELKSYVFPRNQLNKEYLPVLEKAGFTSYRGNPSGFFYKKSLQALREKVNRGFRLVDRYVPVGGPHTHQWPKAGKLRNVPASMFLAPTKNYSGFKNRIRLSRIKNSMSEAARMNKIFHLWWHPHNFSKDREENFSFLSEILNHHKELQQNFSFSSLNMKEVAQIK